jgi:hypothetical protein
MSLQANQIKHKKNGARRTREAVQTKRADCEAQKKCSRIVGPQHGKKGRA